MNVFIMRHGVAEDIGGKIRSDAARPLSPDGLKLVRDEARGLNRLGIHFNVILTSPLVRAKETAEVVAEVLDCKNRVHICDALSIPLSTADLMEEFKTFQDDYNVLLVGHQPDLGHLCGFFIGNNRFNLSLKKGSLCKISVDRLRPTPRGEVKWYMTSRQLKFIGLS
ncbi:MAG: phosphohistidine phosphatase SixA [Bacteroidetes bacterium]|nr:phosphohistidine phosphatase SixA [Bacteroidota bacterium]